MNPTPDQTDSNLVSMAAFLRGGEAEVPLTTRTCDYCGGTGRLRIQGLRYQHPDGDAKCGRCEGIGRITTPTRKFKIPAPTLQEQIDRYTKQADALVARRRMARAARHYAAQLARLPLGERISPILKAVPTQEDA